MARPAKPRARWTVSSTPPPLSRGQAYVQAGHGLQNKPDTWFTPQGGGLMPGRSSGQDKEAVVQGPERRTLGGASLRILPALGAFIACAAWGRYAKRHVGGSGPEAGHRLPRPRHGLLAGQGRNVNHVPGLKCKGCARFVPEGESRMTGEGGGRRRLFRLRGVYAKMSP